MSSLAQRSEAIETYLEEQEYHGKSERTLRAYRRVLEEFAEWVEDKEGPEALDEVDRRTCMGWVHSLRARHKPSTVASYASYVHRFYNYMGDIGEFDENPMALVIDQMDESIDPNPIRRDIGIPEMREFVQTLSHPLTRALVVTFLKTGIRVGELSNLDLRDISLQEVPLDVEYPSPRAALDGRPGAIYVDTTPARGREVNGELRTASNKRKRATIIPIDDELHHVLLEWLAIRPDARSTAEPLFIDTAESWGERLSPAQIRTRLKPHTQEMGWYREGADRSENVTPHYFRHFFTTHMRDRIGDRGIVKYLRGDVADDVIETYTHNWGDRVRARYLEHVYSLL